MKNRIRKTILSAVILPILMMTGCYAHTAKEIANLPNTAAVKIEAGVEVVICNQQRQCLSAFDLVSMGSGVVVSHHRNSSFTLTAGHVCDSPVRLLTPIIATDDDTRRMLAQVLRRVEQLAGRAAPEGFTPVVASMEWTIRVKDTNHRVYQTRIINIDPPMGAPGDLDLCLAASPRINAQAAKIGMSSPERGDRIYNISAPAGEFFQGDGGMIYQGILVSTDGLNGSSIFSIPAAPGSSGSAIFNSEGEVIGIVSAVHMRVPNYTIGASLEDIRCYLHQHLGEHAPRGARCE